MLTHCVIGVLVTTAVVTSQSAQLVGSIVDASAIIRGVPGFGGADLFGGACRDQQGNYWTCARNNGSWFAFRIDASNQVNGVANINYTGLGAFSDMTFDAQRQNVWIKVNNLVRVISATTGSVAFGGFALGGGGIAWDGANRVYSAGSGTHYAADTFATAPNVGTYPPVVHKGLAYVPSTGKFWGGSDSPADPAGITGDSFFEHSTPASTMPPETSIVFDPVSPSSHRGGAVGGMDAWQDPATGEWLGVFCQRVASGDVKLYTARLSEATGGNCGGPMFSAGPSVVQNQLYASGANLDAFAWLMVSFNYQSFSASIFAPGCTVEIDPIGPTIFGAYLPAFGGSLSMSAPVPVSPAFQELPIYFQWVTLDFGGNLTLSEGRSAAIKQF